MTVLAAFAAGFALGRWWRWELARARMWSAITTALEEARRP
jgi:hypothetical protein